MTKSLRRIGITASTALLSAALLSGIANAASAATPDNQAGARLVSAAAPPHSAPDYSGQRLKDVDFSGQDLSGARFVGADLEDVNFGHAKLTGADFSGAYLTRVNLADTNAANAQFENSRIADSAIIRATLTGANFRFALMGNVDFTNSNLTGGSITFAHGNKLYFTGANLTGVNAGAAELKSSDWAGANLTHADFTSVHLHGARQLGEATADGQPLLPANQTAQSSDGEPVPVSWPVPQVEGMTVGFSASPSSAFPVGQTQVSVSVSTYRTPPIEVGTFTVTVDQVQG